MSRCFHELVFRQRLHELPHRAAARQSARARHRHHARLRRRQRARADGAHARRLAGGGRRWRGAAGPHPGGCRETRGARPFADAAPRCRPRAQLDVSGGDIDDGKRRYLVRTVGRFDTRRGHRESDPHAARRCDHAVARRGHRAAWTTVEIDSRSYTNGEPNVRLSLSAQTGSNVIDHQGSRPTRGRADSTARCSARRSAHASSPTTTCATSRIGAQCPGRTS